MRESIVANAAVLPSTMPDQLQRRASLELIAQALLSADCRDQRRPLERFRELEPERQRPYLDAAALAFNSLNLGRVQAATREAAQAHADLDAAIVDELPAPIDVGSRHGLETLARTTHIVSAYRNHLTRS